MAEDILSLKWNNHKPAFFNLLKTLREKGHHTDITLACGSRFFPAHRLVLVACSQFFSEVLEHTGCGRPVIVLKDVCAGEMEALLDYMYLGEVDVPQTSLPGLIKAAESLRIKGLAVPDPDAATTTATTTTATTAAATTTATTTATTATNTDGGVEGPAVAPALPGVGTAGLTTSTSSPGPAAAPAPPGIEAAGSTTFTSSPGPVAAPAPPAVGAAGPTTSTSPPEPAASATCAGAGVAGPSTSPTSWAASATCTGVGASGSKPSPLSVGAVAPPVSAENENLPLPQLPPSTTTTTTNDPQELNNRPAKRRRISEDLDSSSEFKIEVIEVKTEAVEIAENFEPTELEFDPFLHEENFGTDVFGNSNTAGTSGGVHEEDSKGESSNDSPGLFSPSFLIGRPPHDGGQSDYKREEEEETQDMPPASSRGHPLSTQAHTPHRLARRFTSKSKREARDSSFEEGDAAASPVLGSKRTRRPGLLLTIEQERGLVEWFQEHQLFYNKKLRDYKDVAKKYRLLENKAQELNVEADQLRTWMDGMRTRFGRLCSRRSGQGAVMEELTERDTWIYTNFDFLRPHIVRRSHFLNKEVT